MFENLEKALIGQFAGTAKQFYEREFDFFGKVTNISAIIKPYPKGEIEDHVMYCRNTYLWMSQTYPYMKVSEN